MAKGQRTLDGKILAEEVVIRGWGIDEACKRFGISNQTYWKILHSSKPLSPRTEARIYKALRESPAPNGMRGLMKAPPEDEYGYGP